MEYLRRNYLYSPQPHKMYMHAEELEGNEKS
jgi:hypothetical protein